MAEGPECFCTLHPPSSFSVSNSNDCSARPLPGLHLTYFQPFLVHGCFWKVTITFPFITRTWMSVSSPLPAPRLVPGGCILVREVQVSDGATGGQTQWPTFSSSSRVQGDHLADWVTTLLLMPGPDIVCNAAVMSPHYTLHCFYKGNEMEYPPVHWSELSSYIQYHGGWKGKPRDSLISFDILFDTSYCFIGSRLLWFWAL